MISVIFSRYHLRLWIEPAYWEEISGWATQYSTLYHVMRKSVCILFLQLLGDNLRGCQDTCCYITNHKDCSNLHDTPNLLPHQIRCLLHSYLVAYVILCHYGNFSDDYFMNL